MTDIVEQLGPDEVLQEARELLRFYQASDPSKPYTCSVIADCISMIEALRAASEWLDISTAPRDGSKPILGYQETPGDFEYQWGVCWAIDMLDGSLVWLGSGGLTPTLWMPLPAPPQRNEVKK